MANGAVLTPHNGGDANATGSFQEVILSMSFKETFLAGLLLVLVKTVIGKCRLLRNILSSLKSHYGL